MSAPTYMLVSDFYVYVYGVYVSSSTIKQQLLKHLNQKSNF